jgi:hypothetical protein
MRARKSGLAMVGALALGVAACSTGANGPDPSTDPAPTAAPTTVASYSSGDSLVRISNPQYDTAVRDLLGLTDIAPSTFPADTTSGDHFADYFAAADSLGEQTFANPILVSRLLTCTPSDQDTTCTRQIVAQFGTAAWRTPMTTSDVDALTKVATDAVALGETPTNSIKQVVKTVLASPQFLYNVVPAQQL